MSTRSEASSDTEPVLVKINIAPPTPAGRLVGDVAPGWWIKPAF